MVASTQSDGLTAAVALGGTCQGLANALAKSLTNPEGDRTNGNEDVA